LTLSLESEYDEDGAELPFEAEKVGLAVIEAACKKLDFPYDPDVGLLLVSEKEMQGINREQRGIDRSTDVLSFPMFAYESAGDFTCIEQERECFNPDTGEVFLGDIVLCIPKMKEQAALYGHSEKREFAFLILHSILHLFGFDHMEGGEAKAMEALQDEILAKLKIER
jgi:probable rRNA maturation factor